MISRLRWYSLCKYSSLSLNSWGGLSNWCELGGTLAKSLLANQTLVSKISQSGAKAKSINLKTSLGMFIFLRPNIQAQKQFFPVQFRSNFRRKVFWKFGRLSSQNSEILAKKRLLRCPAPLSQKTTIKSVIQTFIKWIIDSERIRPSN